MSTETVKGIWKSELNCRFYFYRHSFQPSGSRNGFINSMNIIEISLTEHFKIQSSIKRKHLTTEKKLAE